MTTSKIEWTQETWNPIVGCSIVSPGCTNCYAMKQAARLQKMNPTGGSGSGYVNHYDGTTKKMNGNVVWTGKIAIAPDRIFLEPLRRKKPTTWFVNSMGDLFHEDVPDEAIDRVFAVMALCPQHTFQVLTKRPEPMQRYCVDESAPHRIARAILDVSMSDKARWTCDPWPVESIGDDVDMPDDVTMKNWPLPNVWLGTSAEDQQRADERIPLLLQTPAAVRFVSLEPLLGPIDLMSIEAPETRNVLDWVICGGESGPHARPMHPDWARSLRDQCAAAGVPFFFKQWGEWRPPGPTSEYDTGGHVPGLPRALIISQDGTVHHFGETAGDGAKSMLRVGKRAAGRLLDGKEHNAMPGR